MPDFGRFFPPAVNIGFSRVRIVILTIRYFAVCVRFLASAEIFVLFCRRVGRRGGMGDLP